MDLKSFRELPLIGILRGVKADVIDPLVETVLSSGLRAIEITMNTPNAPALIRRMKQSSRGRLTIGAGTVMTMNDLRLAMDAGATFIVMPTLINSVMKYCVENSIPVFPGALTPQEIYNAWQAKATMVKVFPVKFFGPDYIKEIKGPLQDIELLACGGVTPDTIQSFFFCGASAVAFGASVFKEKWLKTGNFASIGKCIKALIKGYKKIASR
ncbi:MAG: bifunctional 4-hydroxy-2-oxoglutarate aldolase/2-dehydro-3-deoxy-phosphogluconate aldolase [Candidatus Omnitrophota bacterium]